MTSKALARPWWLLFAPLIGALTAVVTSLGLSLTIAIAYSFVYAASFGRPSPEELQRLARLVPEIQSLGGWVSYALLFACAYFVARRWAVDSLRAAALMALGARLGAAPFILAYAGRIGIGEVVYLIIGFAVAANGLLLGRRVRESLDRSHATARAIRNAHSVSEMLDAIAQHALRGETARVLLFRVEGTRWHLVGDSSNDESILETLDAAELGTSKRKPGPFRLAPDWIVENASWIGETKRPVWGVTLNCPEGPEGLLVLVPSAGDRRSLPGRDEAWLSITEQLALAWHRQLLLEQVRAITRKHERERFAHEIHDGLAQDLVSAVRYVEAARQKTDLSHDVTAELYQLERIVRQCLATARELAWSSWERRKRRGDEISTMLAEIAERWSKQTQIALRFEKVGVEPRLSEDTFELLLGATREALNNVRKHAGASQVSVTLTTLAQKLALDICDNGLGRPVEIGAKNATRADTGGFGLVTLQKRIAERNGQVVVEHTPGEGFALSIQLPLG